MLLLLTFFVLSGQTTETNSHKSMRKAKGLDRALPQGPHGVCVVGICGFVGQCVVG